MSEVTQGPRSSVFTTMRFSKEHGLFLFEQHLIRLIDHAKKLKIDDSNINRDVIWHHLRENPPDFDEGLLRIECTKASPVNVAYRPFSLQNEQVDAVTVPSPIWPTRIAGTKHGAWDAYLKARKHAEEMGADLALMVHEYSIVDGDRCSPFILDEDGVIWISDSRHSVESITFEALRSPLLNGGYHIQRGKLNERLVARCVEAVAVGSGVGVLKIDSIDNEPIGDESSRLFEFCSSAFEEIYSNPKNWEGVW